MMRLNSITVYSKVILLFYLALKAETVARGTVRFFRDGSPTITQSWSSGIVQIYYSDQWGNICDDANFGLTEATVICHQFGYTGASSFTNTGTTTLYGNDNSSVVMNDVSCSTSEYLTITQCSFDTPSGLDFVTCTDNTDVMLFCYSARIWDSPSPGDIRLIDGLYSNQGLLEVYCNGDWGTVCDDTFTSLQAEVACKQLGYNSYISYDHLSISGALFQKIWLDNFHSCLSSSTCLTSCQACPLSEDHNCVHTEDVTLECGYEIDDTDASSTTNNNCNIVEPDLTSSANTTLIIAIIVASVVGAFICLLIVTVPLCICCCLGIGISATSNRNKPSKTVVNQPAATTTVITTTNEKLSNPQEDKTPAAAYPAQAAPLPYKEAYPTQPVYPQQQQQPYPPQGYPPQEYPPQGYPPQEYPPQGYPPQEYPPQGYPPQEYPPQPYPPQEYPAQ